MLAEEMWKAYQVINPEIGDEIDAWQFGDDLDNLANLVLDGIKTATASAYELYEEDDEPLPQEGTYDVILDSQNQAVCIIKITKVSIVPFEDVSEDHAYKEGEGDKTLAYWRQVHRDFFEPYFKECGKIFCSDSPLVLEEFEKVYPLD